MTISLTEDFRTVEDLRESTEAILAQARSTGRPVNITVDGKPAAVLLDVGVFERWMRTLNLVKLLAPAEEDILAGRTQPLDEFMKEFCLANQIPGPHIGGSKKRHSNNSRPDRAGQKKGSRQVGS
jgi:prevent-host-death family protein